MEIRKMRYCWVLLMSYPIWGDIASYFLLQILFPLYIIEIFKQNYKVGDGHHDNAEKTGRSPLPLLCCNIAPCAVIIVLPSSLKTLFLCHHCHYNDYQYHHHFHEHSCHHPAATPTPAMICIIIIIKVNIDTTLIAIITNKMGRFNIIKLLHRTKCKSLVIIYS